MSKGTRRKGRMRRIFRILMLRDPEQAYPRQVDPAAQRQYDIQKGIADQQRARADTGFF